MTTDKKDDSPLKPATQPSITPEKKVEQTKKEKLLAEALRNNLRRRKEK